MVTKVLCVAEKPSIAKAVAGHLSSGQLQTRNSRNQYVKNYCFQYNFPTWGSCEVVMTSVLGHLLSHDFNGHYKSWSSCDPSALFEAPIDTFVQQDKKAVSDNIKQEARSSQYLYIWTDCDREGENIGSEIRSVALETNRSLSGPGKTMRARFSNIERAHIINAARSPVPLDEHQAIAVASRIELDLRIGASFTRALTLALRAMLIQHGEKEQVVSYGSCQFPTLGFVVERYFRVRNFVPEPFWGIRVMHQKDGIKVTFNWSRVHLFDRMIVTILFERCLVAKSAQVTKMQTKPTSKWKPLPLTTVELQKCGSRFLRMDSQKTLQVAEKLYNAGWISYPRTETDQFDRGMDLQGLVRKQTQGGPWAPFAQGLVDGGFEWPRNGRNNDKAHPPIHPVNFVVPTQLSAEEQRVHEFVVRRFLACCAPDAKGARTDVSILYGSEIFNASGLTVLERNWLDVYPYDNWTSTQALPQFQEGETFEPNEANVFEGKTSPPGYLTEPELIALMDANGIGTDATMAEHIAKIKERKYVETRARGVQPLSNDGHDENRPVQGRARGGGRGPSSSIQEFIPTTLGVALVEGYDSMGFETSLTKPFLRKEMELKMKAICEGRISHRQVVEETIEQYRAVYMRTQSQLDVLRKSVRKYVFGEDVT